MTTVIARSMRDSKTGIVDTSAPAVFKRKLTDDDAEIWRQRYNNQGYTVVAVVNDERSYN